MQRTTRTVFTGAPSPGAMRSIETAPRGSALADVSGGGAP